MLKFTAIAMLMIGLLSVTKVEADVQLSTPHTVDLSPAVSLPRCSAITATTNGYASVVTGFSSDGNYVLGQVQATWVCGSSGRGGGLHYYGVCTQLQWDLSGTLISINASVGFSAPGVPVSVNCPSVTFQVLPSKLPPSSSVIGNEFTNSGGYVAETVIEEACGSAACYATYYIPTLIAP